MRLRPLLFNEVLCFALKQSEERCLNVPVKLVFLRYSTQSFVINTFYRLNVLYNVRAKIELIGFASYECMRKMKNQYNFSIIVFSL